MENLATMTWVIASTGAAIAELLAVINGIALLPAAGLALLSFIVVFGILKLVAIFCRLKRP